MRSHTCCSARVSVVDSKAYPGPPAVTPNVNSRRALQADPVRAGDGAIEMVRAVQCGLRRPVEDGVVQEQERGGGLHGALPAVRLHEASGV
eukprot:3938967-Rhodomonas_salina.4